MRQQVQREALFLKELPSTHFIKLYHSFFEQNGHGNWYFFLAMEYASQGDLQSNLISKAKSNQHIISEKEIWRICRTVAQGLQMLHSRSIMHKDIKPQNILMMDDASVKVGDFYHYSANFIPCLDRRHGHLNLAR